MEIINNKKKFILLITGRQAGKTETLCQLIIKRALERPGGVYYWIAPDLTQARVATRVIQNYLIDIADYSAQSKQFKLINGSTIDIRTAESPVNLRGDSLSGCVIDEAAFIKPEIYHEAISPALKVKNGWCYLASTPNGYNWYFDLYSAVKESEDWYIKECPSWANPLMIKEELEKEIPIKGIVKWEQEYGGKWASPSGAVFDPRWFDNIFVNELPKDYNRSIIAVDLSCGHLTSDYQAIVFCGYVNDIMWIDAKAYKTDVTFILEEAVRMADQYKAEGIAIETNFFQVLAVDVLENKFGNRLLPPIIRVNNKVKKETRIQRLAELFVKNKVRVLDTIGGRLFVNQCREFPMGDNDDLPDAVEMGYRFFCHEAF